MPDIAEWNSSWLTHPLFESVRYVGQEKWKGAEYDVVEWTYGRAAELPERQDTYTSRAFIGVNDTIVRRVTSIQCSNGKVVRNFESELLELELDAPLTPADFSPPSQPVKEVKPQYLAAAVYLNKSWPALNEPARLLDGAAVNSVHDLLKGKKALLLWAWNTDCSSCVEEFPLMEQLRKEYESKGVQMVAVNSGEGDEWEASKRYMAYHQAAMPVIFNATAWNKPIYDSVALAILDNKGTVVYAGDCDFSRIREKLNQLVKH